MSLQNAVNFDIAPGIAGDRATLNPVVYATLNPIAGSAVNIGSFVWPASANPEDVAVQSGSGEPMGFVERWFAYAGEVTPTLTVPEGSTLQVARRGDFWAVCSNAATAGQKVFANTTTGAISAAAGATVAGSVETSWIVKRGGAAGELIVISSWDAAQYIPPPPPQAGS
jgi:hypothetical protein